MVTGLGSAIAGLILADWYFMAYGGVCELAAIALLILGWRD